MIYVYSFIDIVYRVVFVGELVSGCIRFYRLEVDSVLFRVGKEVERDNLFFFLK